MIRIVNVVVIINVLLIIILEIKFKQLKLHLCIFLHFALLLQLRPILMKSHSQPFTGISNTHAMFHSAQNISIKSLQRSEFVKTKDVWRKFSKDI